MIVSVTMHCRLFICDSDILANGTGFVSIKHIELLDETQTAAFRHTHPSS